MRRVFAQKPAVPASQERAARSACRALRGTSRGRRACSPWDLAMFQCGRWAPELDRKPSRALADLDERSVKQYLRYRAGKQSIQPGDRSALKRWLSVLREEGAIAPAVYRLSPHTIRFQRVRCLSATERGLAPKSIVRHLPVIRRFLHEVCPAGDDDLGKISQEEVIRYIERHAQDWSPGTGKAMCWSLRAFLRYLHHRGLNSRALADCVPSMRRWKLASLPTFCPPSRCRGHSMVATGQLLWDGGTTPF